MRYLLLFLLPLCLTAQDRSARLDSLLDAEVAARHFSGVVLLAEDGQPVYQQARGHADAAAKLPLTPETPMRIASMTKAFTAVLVMQLIEAGQWTEETTIAEVLPELAVKRAKKTTVADLLLHRSGLPQGTAAHYKAEHSAAEMVALAVQDGRYGKRGTFRYSNTDYLLLGLMLEAATGQSFAELLQSRIFDPVGMTQTGLARHDQAGLALGYQRDEAGDFQPEAAYFIQNGQAAAAMYSTAGDLLRFDQALYTDQLLQPKTIAQMYTSHPELGYVAFGSWVYDYYFLPASPRLVERRGQLPGFNHVFIRAPDQRKTLLVLSNNDQFDPDTFGQLDSFKDRLIALLMEE